MEDPASGIFRVTGTFPIQSLWHQVCSTFVLEHQAAYHPGLQHFRIPGCSERYALIVKVLFQSKQDILELIDRKAIQTGIKKKITIQRSWSNFLCQSISRRNQKLGQ